MTTATSPWHKQSYDRFVNDGLPALLAARLPLDGYQATPLDSHTCRISVAIASADAVQAAYDLPAPNDDGVFHLDGRRIIVIPIADSEALAAARIRCVGEQFLQMLEGQLGQANDDMPWSPSLLKAWLPLDELITDFLRGALPIAPNQLRSQQPLDDRNWLSRVEHLRRIVIPTRRDVIHPDQIGRTCPFTTPEGPNIGKVLSIARGAAIRDGRIVIDDHAPQAALGVTAACIPLVEFDDNNRVLMGANMMRQWLVPRTPEPALVQTGHEPAAPDFWCGRNLLTAFICLGAGTYEDGITLSQSAANQLTIDHPLEPGDKLSNRHGTKGVIAQILPDDQMPHTQDDRPVDLAFSFIGCHTRLNFGQIMEAAWGRIANKTGDIITLPPFATPQGESLLHDLRERLRAQGLPETGMERLRDSAGGDLLDGPTTVGYVYWGLTYHVARENLKASATSAVQKHDHLNYTALRDAGAYATILDAFHTRGQRIDLAAQIASDQASAPPVPSPACEALRDRLRCAGIDMRFDGERLTFGLAAPTGESVDLAQSQPHPWLPRITLRALGGSDSDERFLAVRRTSDRLRKLLGERSPRTLIEAASAQLCQQVGDYLDALLLPEALHFSSRSWLTARAVIAPAIDLAHDQIGLPADIAWPLFEPLLRRAGVGAEACASRSQQAAAELAKLMDEKRVIAFRAPTLMSASLIAFRPVLTDERAIRLHTMSCMFMNCDFDGDQIGISLPLSDDAQAEAAAKLSVAGHLQRDPALVRWLVPTHEAMYGLSRLSLTEAGRAEVVKLAGMPIDMPDGFLRRTDLITAMADKLAQVGPHDLLHTLETLRLRGLAVTRRSGASISPFIADAIDKSQLDGLTDDADIEVAVARLAEAIERRRDFDDELVGPQLLAVLGGSRGNLKQLQTLIGVPRRIVDGHGRLHYQHKGAAEGRTPEEAFNCSFGARRGIANMNFEQMRAVYGQKTPSTPTGLGVIARAMRSDRPGVVFASAAANGEVDPLTDRDTRLFVGLMPS